MQESQARTEEQIVAKAPIQAKLGDKTYDIQILSIRKAREWRELFVRKVGEISEEMQKNLDGQATFMTALGFSFCGFPEKIAELVFSYAPSLPSETILDEATEEQMAHVFAEIVKVAFPFSNELSLISRTAGLASLQASAKSMSSPSASGA